VRKEVDERKLQKVEVDTVAAVLKEDAGETEGINKGGWI
jgi:hypothetical protein